MRTFAYCRVSTAEQDTETQILAIRKAGYEVQDSRVISEVVSGGMQAMQRPEFKALVEHKLEAGDRLVVLKLDRLGRDSIDIQTTIKQLQEKQIEVVSLDMPTVKNITGAEGMLMMQLLAAFAQFERERIKERTREGLERAKAKGKKMGRPVATETREAVAKAQRDGLSQSHAAKVLGLSTRTIKRYWEGEEKA
ncbi:DNA invertase Pin-like site-specific DNA recombinase [Aeromonas hydrophila]|uniref:recombinase family protein n=1 Tax=Aeromonas TaxID=642 RepID=UPI0013C849F0|nr:MULTISPECIES: recombinase family protein [Aeromonas]EKP0299441.1 recombinase family protein [Aeromonas veronii]MBM0419846.1 recombinase family protein [Aeromonas veronii]MBW3790348.1 recombinase family protein [Aeromonas veronii]MCS3766046.1 DNA invertase Pin-like site-specific DNA recombinase [Aeromonas hydrophila]MCS3790876.1 DNA invertase Pin-like site-specific DNA recombinase [Aeromonas hydrophila]